MIFFLGVSLALGSLAGIMKDKPDRVKLWQADELLEEDYQKNYRFRDYIAGRFWASLAMATGGDLERVGSYYYGDVYWDGYRYRSYDWENEDEGWAGRAYDYEENLRAYEEDLEDMQDTYRDMVDEWEQMEEKSSEEAEAYHKEIESFQMEIESFQREIEEYKADMENYRREMGISREEEEASQRGQESESADRRKKELARKYHDSVKGDKNLLYTISYDGEELYANSDLLAADGKMTAPEGYNFLLYFDGEKVRIVKDGKELDVYGDGYYREESGWQEGSDWYVPGYLNFPADEGMKKASIFLAAAREPVLYMEGNYGKGDVGQYDNSLYWMHYNCLENQKRLQREGACFALGLALLVLAFFSRKSRREAAGTIAGLQAKIWAEPKVILLLGLLSLVFVITKSSNQEYGWWQELIEIYYYDYGAGNLPGFVWEILKNAHPAVWVILFWGIWLIWNDLKYNKKPWKVSLAGKIYRTFRVKGITWPLARKMASRDRAVFAGAVLYALLMLGMAVRWISGHRSTTALALLIFAGTAVFLFLLYLTGRKNMEAARDMDALSGYIGEIRNGNYTDIDGDFAGHDLEHVMAQLEDIRHGMEKAVEEQMKSQKMKVELIANVSHDIKTPLTSIISYVQFLKQEEGLPEHVKDYVRILDEKSQRLKNMVQDVFAVSKAASGELPVHMEELDFGKLLRQTLADMEEQIEGSAVSFRTELPQTPVMILADGQRMYRVFQNLFQNAIQYSLAGSRVYVTLKTDGSMAVASVKNASLMELDKEKDFAERFARGDQSRTDGGSGLGLSIAQSFTEACCGEFSWETDADLFVVKVSFHRIEGRL